MPPREKEPLQIVLEGELTESSLGEQLAGVGARLGPERRSLVVDCRPMTHYTTAARGLFVRWNREHKSKLSRVAIITDKPLWRLVISAMALASTQEMRAFDAAEDAHRWAEDPS